MDQGQAPIFGGLLDCFDFDYLINLNQTAKTSNAPRIGVFILSKSKEDTTFIYALCDPDTNEVRYVGKSDNPVKRLKRHLGGYEPRPTHKSNWIKSLLWSKKEPVLKILEEIPRSVWQEAERKWMDYYSQNGANLTNTAEGGIGGRTVPFFSEEERAKRSKRGKKRMTAIWAEIRAERQAERNYIKELRKDPHYE